MDKYTSLELSKKLAENGCQFESDYYREIYPAYDILNDICVKYAKEFFGYSYEGKIILKKNGCRRCYPTIGYREPTKIIHLLQQNKKQEAEDYIWEHCLFNTN